MWGALAVCVGISMYLVKYKVQALEDELTAKREQIVHDRGAIRVLEAEWTYLNDPGRLRRLSAQYLGFGPAIPQNVVTLDSLPMRPHDQSGSGQIGSNHAPMDDSLTGLKQPQNMGPTVHAANTAPDAGPFATPRPVGVPALVARLQRLLFPDAVGATTSGEERPR
jgi:hypothetical protein